MRALFASFLIFSAQIASPQNTASSYSQLRAKLGAKRAEISQRLQRASSEDQKNRVIEEASSILRNDLRKHIFPPWYGTKWDFNGTSSTPKKGVIACGYFVSTTLRDAGLVLNRYRLAQLYSHDIVKKLSEEISTHSTAEETLKHLRSKADDFYVVGLDQHVGFLFKEGQEVHFIHSSYGNPQEVLSEDADQSEVFKQSKLYVVGRLGGPKGIITRWLNQTPIR